MEVEISESSQQKAEAGRFEEEILQVDNARLARWETGIHRIRRINRGQGRKI